MTDLNGSSLSTTLSTTPTTSCAILRTLHIREGPALFRLAETSFDLLVLDIRMLAPDGLKVTRRVRADSATALVPIIPVTGLGACQADETPWPGHY